LADDDTPGAVEDDWTYEVNAQPMHNSIATPIRFCWRGFVTDAAIDITFVDDHRALN
jgi:hypothetical protein